MQNKKQATVAIVGVFFLLLFAAITLWGVPQLFGGNEDTTEPEASEDSQTLGIERDTSPTSFPGVSGIAPSDVQVQDDEDTTEEESAENANSEENTNSQNQGGNTFASNPTPQPSPRPVPTPQPEPTPQPQPEPTPEPEPSPEEEVIEYNTFSSEIFDFSFDYKAEYGDTIVTPLFKTWDDNRFYGERIEFAMNAYLFAHISYIDIQGFGAGGPYETEVLYTEDIMSKTNQTFSTSGTKLTNTDTQEVHYDAGASYLNDQVPDTDNDYHISFSTTFENESDVESTRQEMKDIVESVELDTKNMDEEIANLPISFPVN